MDDERATPQSDNNGHSWNLEEYLYLADESTSTDLEGLIDSFMEYLDQPEQEQLSDNAIQLPNYKQLPQHAIQTPNDGFIPTSVIQTNTCDVQLDAGVVEEPNHLQMFGDSELYSYDLFPADTRPANSCQAEDTIYWAVETFHERGSASECATPLHDPEYNTWECGSPLQDQSQWEQLPENVGQHLTDNEQLHCPTGKPQVTVFQQDIETLVGLEETSVQLCLTIVDDTQSTNCVQKEATVTTVETVENIEESAMADETPSKKKRDKSTSGATKRCLKQVCKNVPLKKSRVKQSTKQTSLDLLVEQELKKKKSLEKKCRDREEMIKVWKNKSFERGSLHFVPHQT